jgi:hypothetical protein
MRHKPKRVSHIIKLDRKYTFAVHKTDPLVACAYSSKGVRLSFAHSVGQVRVSFSKDDSWRHYIPVAVSVGDESERTIDRETRETIATSFDPRPTAVHAMPHDPDMTLCVEFENYVNRYYKMAPLLDKEIKNPPCCPQKLYAPLADLHLFNKCELSPGGFAVLWGLDIDISMDEIWRNGLTEYTAP